MVQTFLSAINGLENPFSFMTCPMLTRERDAPATLITAPYSHLEAIF